MSFDPGSPLMETHLEVVHSWCELVEPSWSYTNLIASTTTDLPLQIKLIKSNAKYFHIIANHRDHKECVIFGLSSVIISQKKNSAKWFSPSCHLLSFLGLLYNTFFSYFVFQNSSSSVTTTEFKHLILTLDELTIKIKHFSLLINCMYCS